MHPREECKLLAHYAANLFEAKRDSDKLDIALQALDPQIFAPNAWMRALQSLRPGKAVPVHEPTVQCWRDCRREVACEGGQSSLQAREPEDDWIDACGHEGFLDCTQE